MSEEIMIKNCSPTLTGIKTGSLFSAELSGRDNEILRSWNALLRQKGLRALPLGTVNTRTLVYVYRISRLRRDLKAPDARRILTERGYNCESPERCIARLARRIKSEPEFPHEIGLFLGYPPNDVRGFINREKCRFTGMWKVYGNEKQARETFERYKACTSAISHMLETASPVDVLKLIVKGD